jgi:DhnA family fructose-bisphosphate aldolase class Ia
VLDLDLQRVRDLRALSPAAIVDAAMQRRKRPLLVGDKRLMLVAADHPARGALGVGGRSGVMGDRNELLSRLVCALERPGVDGVLGTADILDDLLLLGALDDKVVIGSMNRGGLLGASFEMDDRFTGYDANAIAAMGFDGGKMLTRVDLNDTGTVSTLENCADAINDLADHGLMAMVEPFMSSRVNGKVQNDLSAEAVILSVAISSGLGRTSRHTWLKLPVVDDMERVMASTTMPTLLLGGDPTGDQEDTFASWERALAAPGVRGLVVGRSLLYPADGDVAGAVDAAVAMVHGPSSSAP